MTRKEMIEILNKYCESRIDPTCHNCPVQKDDAIGEGCVEFAYRTDEELAECIEKIAQASIADDVQPVKHMVAVSRDELCAMRGRLLMIASCSGVTITDAMADELQIMAEMIEEALEENEDIIG